MQTQLRTGMGWIIIMIAVGVAKWVVYTALLWIMIQLQKMQYNWLGLLGSSALATALGFIPVVGPYIGWAALVLCLWKVTHADIAPDVLFTVSIAGALMFCVNLFVIGALMGNLGLAGALADVDDDEGMDADGFELVDNSAMSHDDDLEVDESEATNVVAKATTPVAAMPPARTSASVTPMPASASTRVAPLVATLKPSALIANESIRDASSLPAKLSLKGLAVQSSQRTAMIGDGKEIHTVGIGDMFSVPSPRGTLLLRCEDITAREVILALDKGDRVRLTFQ